MNKNKQLIIVLSTAAVILALCLTTISVFIIKYSGKKSENVPDVTTDLAETVIDTEKINTEYGSSDTAGITESLTEAPSETHEVQTEPQTTDAESGVHFEEVNEKVTAKRKVNLRSSMDQSGDKNIVFSLVNGETATRTGIGENGWSRIIFNSQTLYCVSSYLTADLSYVPPAETEGFKTKFTPVNEKITAKDVTNLRDIPSVMEPSQVVAQLNHGEVATRTGIAGEGWSRVEYNGQTLYCISSYIELIEE